MMKTLKQFLVLGLAVLLPVSGAMADDHSDTIKIFRGAVESKGFFDTAYGYAVFPIIGKAGVAVGGAFGEGRVYAGGKHVGNAKMTQLSVGFQFGAQTYRQIIFFENRRTFAEFTSGNFEFGAQASAVAVTAGAQAAAATTGSSAGASATDKKAATVGKYRKGMAVFTVAKGGLMYEASIGGQKFSYTAR